MPRRGERCRNVCFKIYREFSQGLEKTRGMMLQVTKRMRNIEAESRRIESTARQGMWSCRHDELAGEVLTAEQTGGQGAGLHDDLVILNSLPIIYGKRLVCSMYTKPPTGRGVAHAALGSAETGWMSIPYVSFRRCRLRSS